MINDPDLIVQLDALPKETFNGEVFRGTRQSLDPLASSYSGGRWMRRDGVGVLYTSLAREGALAEISPQGSTHPAPDQAGHAAHAARCGPPHAEARQS